MSSIRPDAHPDPGRDPVRRITTHTDVDTVVRRGWRGVGGWWWPALLLVPLLLAGLAALTTHGSVESDLAARSTDALKKAGLGGSVAFSGRDGTLTGGDAAAKALVEKVSGVRVVDAAAGGVGAVTATPSATGGAGGAAAPFGLATSADGKTLTVTATVPDDAAKTALLDAVRAANPGVTVEDKVTVSAGVGALPAAGLAALSSALKGLPGVNVAGTGSTITLTGAVPSEMVKSAAGQAAAALNPTATIDNQLTVSAPSASPTPSPSPASTGTVSASCATVNTTVAAELKAKPVQFATGSASILPASLTQLKSIAAQLKDCLGAEGGASGLAVEGHTDNQGSDALNTRLSQQRADAVKAALVSAGLPSGKITAKGFGAGKPVATNTTAEGRALNRRVEIRLI